MTAARAEPIVRRPAGADRPARPVRRRTRPRLRVVPAGTNARRRWPFVLFSAVLAGGLLIAVVAAQALVAQNSFRLQDVQRRMQQLQQANDDLRLQVAQASAPGAIADAAHKLGLRLPDPNDVHTLPIAGAGGSLSAGPAGGFAFQPGPAGPP